MIEQTTPEVLDVKQAAALLHCGVGTIYADVRRKKLPHFFVGRCLRFYRSALLSLGAKERR
jgi:excisionase family DNA binding protein